ncbi:hypothetical protein MUP01_14610 [Candidatus Bathyarchaeota archaeon]|nr:hypothetical protein [Candidatus Bathyarchaeota archaeon]
MIAARPILGGVFIAILVFGAVYAIASPILQPIRFPRINVPWLGTGQDNIVDRYSLFKGTNVSSSITFVTLNLTVQIGMLNVVFLDDPNLVCDVSFGRLANASALQAAFAESAANQSSQVNLSGETGAINLTLGNAYQYSGSIDLRIGGIVMELGQNTNINKLAVSIRYLGGVLLRVKSGASFEQLDLNMDIGGLQLEVDATSLKSVCRLNTNISIGGFTMGAQVDTTRVGVSLNAAVDIGGLTVTSGGFEGSITSRNVSVRTHGYDSTSERLDVNATIGLGGGALQSSITSSNFQYSV